MKDTRDRIVSAAYACFLEKGYEQTSVRMILEKAGVTTGSFYHFFPSKEKVFEAAVDAFLTDYVSAFASICHDRELPVTQRWGRYYENPYFGYYNSTCNDVGNECICGHAASCRRDSSIVF